MKTTLRPLGLAAGLLLTALTLFAFSPPGDRTFEIMKNLDIFATLFKELNQYYVDDVNPNRAIRTGIEAMLRELDPYTVFYPEDDIEDYRTMTTGQYSGIGVVTQTRAGKLMITNVLEETPAAKAGLRIGDEIVKVDGVDIKRPGVQIDRLMKGQTGSTVKLTLLRLGQSALEEVTVGRDVVKITNVPYYGMMDAETGYIDLKDFTATAAKEVKDAVADLKAKGMKRLVLDVRENPGGLLMMAVDIANVFLPKDVPVVETKGKIREWNKVYKTTYGPLDTDLPLVVLTNSRSASAAEIVAGALQDYDRGVLVGQRSFGKGLVQVGRDLSYNTKMKVTTAKYYIPSGRCIQAIDYSHRNPDGSVGKIPDSLKTAFQTRNSKRTVYDGGGIDPDVPVERPQQAAITSSLIRQNLIFDYANRYRQAHATVAPARQFKLSDADYQDFVKWLADKTYDYSTEVEQKVNELEASARKEGYYESVQPQLAALKTRFSHNKDTDLMKFRQEIQPLLEQEIVQRYYFQKGVREWSFENDLEIRAGLGLLNDPARYKAILAGKK